MVLTEANKRPKDTGNAGGSDAAEAPGGVPGNAKGAQKKNKKHGSHVVGGGASASEGDGHAGKPPPASSRPRAFLI